MKNNYLVSVFVDGKNVNSYFSDNLDDLVTIKALHKDCEITLFDINNFVHYSQEQVEREVAKSGQRWKKSLERPKITVDSNKNVDEDRQKRKKVKKYWDRPVKCIETGQVFKSIRECCDRLGLSYKSVWNAINSGNGRCGLHFVNAR